MAFVTTGCADAEDLVSGRRARAIRRAVGALDPAARHAYRRGMYQHAKREWKRINRG